MRIGSCLVRPLVEPLVKPLVGRRHTALSGTRLASTALLATALATGGWTADDLRQHADATAEATPAKIAANPHQKPAPRPFREVLQEWFPEAALLHAGLRLRAPVEAARHEAEALRLDRLRPATYDPGPPLWAARAAARRLAGTRDPFLRFGSSIHQSGIPASA